MTAERLHGDPVLGELREQTRRLVSEVGGPLRRVSVRSGDQAVEIEWHELSTPSTPGDDQTAPPGRDSDEAEPRRTAVVSPIVGTFYRAPEPGAPPFVEVGDEVEPGQVVGIVEAMKLMNHITAELAGTVAQVLVGDREPVEYGQPLIVLVPA